MFKLNQLYIGQKEKFFCNRKPLIGEIILLFKNPRISDSNKYYFNINVEVGDECNQKTDKITNSCFDGTYQLKIQDIKEVLK